MSELPRSQKRPKQILDRLATYLVSCKNGFFDNGGALPQEMLKLRSFVLRGRTREGGEIELFDHLPVTGAAADQLADTSAVFGEPIRIRGTDQQV